MGLRDASASNNNLDGFWGYTAIQVWWLNYGLSNMGLRDASAPKKDVSGTWVRSDFVNATCWHLAQWKMKFKTLVYAHFNTSYNISWVTIEFVHPVILETFLSFILWNLGSFVHYNINSNPRGGVKNFQLISVVVLSSHLWKKAWHLNF